MNSQAALKLEADETQLDRIERKLGQLLDILNRDAENPNQRLRNKYEEYTAAILEVMKDGREMHVSAIMHGVVDLKVMPAPVTEVSINRACNTMVETGFLNNPRKGRYVIVTH